MTMRKSAKLLRCQSFIIVLISSAFSSGTPSEKSDMAMDFVNEVVAFDKHEDLFRREDSVRNWDVLLS
jgi:hypothetical protein